MRSVSAKVLNGKVVTRGELPEGAKLTVFVHEQDGDIDLDHNDEAAIADGIAEIEAGQYRSLAELRAFLRRK